MTTIVTTVAYAGVYLMDAACGNVIWMPYGNDPLTSIDAHA